jgi:hypothetical protein
MLAKKNNGEKILAKTNYTRLIIFNNTELIKPRLIISFHPHKSISEAVDTYLTKHHQNSGAEFCSTLEFWSRAAPRWSRVMPNTS